MIRQELRICAFALLLFASVSVTACRSGQRMHVSVGEWRTSDHSLIVYRDGAGSYDGIAISWIRLDEEAIRLELTVESRSLLWEFSVQGGEVGVLKAGTRTTHFKRVQAAR